VSLTAAVAGSAAAVDFTLTIPHGGLTRTALVHVPAGAGDPRSEVVLWRLTGGGHVWPGAESYFPKLLGPPTKVIDANEEMWKFFERFARR
jgi:poly(3-hydroxybutyrate) depolymerase